MPCIIEYLSGCGFWLPLAESTERTGFHMRPVEYPTHEDAEAKIEEMRAVDGSWRGLRVKEMGGS